MGLIGAAIARAHEPITTKLTWTQQISRIIFKRCAGCHHDGGAVFSLASYDAARPWAKAIREEVLERRMPPWGTVEGIRAYQDDPSLTALEIEMIVNWVEGGAPEGDPVYLPSLPSFFASLPKARMPLPRGMVLRNAVTMRETIRATGITPQDLPTGASMEVTAYQPDGTVDHLIWLRNYREQWTRTYWFSDPVELPRGTQVVVHSTAPATAILSFSK